MDDDEREHRLRATCEQFVHWHGRMEPADHLAQLPDQIGADRYGDGGVVEELEETVADLLGKPAAVFMPSGTMAQQIGLRIHADARARRTVAMHPMAHLPLHEAEAATRLHGLILRPVGSPVAPLTRADLDGVDEPLAALLLELPQREIGGPLPAWAELEAMTAWARERGAAVHMDGARLWECGPYYDRPYADIAALFDTVYVSFYKGLGAIAGACLAGEDAVVGQARDWRHRHGGMMFALWPYAASALAALRLRLDRFGDYLRHARAITEALRDVDGIDVTVDPPHTPMLHLWLRNDVRSFRARAFQLAATQGVWTWARGWPSGAPGLCRAELAVGDATMAMAPQHVVDALVHLATPLPDGGPAEELVEVVDDEGAIVDVVSRLRIRAEGLRHRCTYVVVLTSDEELIVHRRAEWKDVDPGVWDLAFGGLCDVGEPWLEAARRELEEEAGLTGLTLQDLGDVSWAAEGVSLVGRAYLARHDGPVHSRDGEATAFDRVPLADLEGWLATHPVAGDTAALIPPLLKGLAG